MQCNSQMLRLYGVTDRAWVGAQTLYQQVESALKGGVTCIQLREKQLDDREFLQEAIAIQALCKSYGVPLIINDNVEVALACGADGVHVGQRDMEAHRVRQLVGPGMIVGVTAATPQLALQAQAQGADYLGVGAVFGSTTKLDAKPLARETLEEICKLVEIPVVAIGGIDRQNILQLAGSGVAGAAIVSGIFAAPDIEGRCKELRALAEEMVLGKGGSKQ